MVEKQEKVIIKGVEYVPKGTQQRLAKAPNIKGMEYCVIRTYSAGVFIGWINTKIKGMERTIYDSRRVFYWKGAASLSQMANDGVKQPDECQITQVVPITYLTEVIEVIPCTRKAKDCLESVSVWEK